MNKFKWFLTGVWAIVNGIVQYGLWGKAWCAIFTIIFTVIFMPILFHVVDWFDDVNEMLKEHKESEDKG